jgi:hypothetical protein
MATKKPVDPDETPREITIMVPKKISCGPTQCRYCKEKSWDGNMCHAYLKPLKRDRAGRPLRCKACLESRRGRR